MVADPGRDLIFVVPSDLQSPHRTVALPEGSVPFRVVVPDDDDSVAFVTLRGTGELARIDLQSAQVGDIVPVCAEPRGVDLDLDEIIVACASGAIVGFDRSLTQTRSVRVADDLRDVVLDGDVVWLSTFRSANVLGLARETLHVIQHVVPDLTVTDEPSSIARVGWRMRGLPEGGGVLLMHQSASGLEIPIEPVPGVPLPYGGGRMACVDDDAVSSTHLTTVTLDSASTSGSLVSRGPRYDFAIGERLHRPSVHLPNGHPGIRLGDLDNPTMISVLPIEFLDLGECQRDTFAEGPRGIVSAIDVGPDGQRWLYQRGRARLTNGHDTVQLADPGEPSLAFDVFHDTTQAGLACASCHPEGQDDGHVWRFSGLGARRTQNLAGGVSQRAPFHWDGEFATLDDLMGTVFGQRMGGDELTPEETEQLGQWLDGIPPVLGSPQEPSLVDDGKVLFHGEAACSSCHEGEQLTDSELHVVREGDPAIKTPSLLGVGSRAPFMHDGCAETLEERFLDEFCGGGDLHGQTSHLTTRDVDALSAYLRTL